MDKKKTVSAFSVADLRRWEAQFEAMAPVGGRGAAAVEMPHVVSVRTQASPYGIGFRFRFADGTETGAFFNAVAARAMAIQILETGAHSGWMPDLMTISPPLIHPDQKRQV